MPPLPGAQPSAARGPAVAAPRSAGTVRAGSALPRAKSAAADVAATTPLDAATTTKPVELAASGGGRHVRGQPAGGTVLASHPPEAAAAGSIRTRTSKGKRQSTSGLQKKLCDLLDKVERLEAIRLSGERASGGDIAAQEHVLRLRDLGAPGTRHDWLWAVHPAFGDVLSPQEYLDCLRIRLGASDVARDDGRAHMVGCASCGAGVDARLFFAHASCCARAASTVGHTHLKRWLHRFSTAADPTARMEVPLAELSLPGGPPAVSTATPDAPLHTPQSTDIVPADVYLTAASSVGGAAGDTAVDCGITSPYTADAFKAAAKGQPEKVDGVANYTRAKNQLYGGPCNAVGVEFRAFVVSAFGRPSPAASSLVEAISRSALRRRGLSPDEADADCPVSIGGFWRGASVILARRLSRMYRCCAPRLPHSSDEERAGVAITYGGVREDFFLHLNAGPVAAGGRLRARRSHGAGVVGTFSDSALRAGSFA